MARHGIGLWIHGCAVLLNRKTLESRISDIAARPPVSTASLQRPIPYNNKVANMAPKDEAVVAIDGAGWIKSFEILRNQSRLFDPEDTSGQHISETMLPAYVEVFLENLNYTLETGNETVFTHLIEMKNGLHCRHGRITRGDSGDAIVYLSTDIDTCPPAK